MSHSVTPCVISLAVATNPKSALRERVGAAILDAAGDRRSPAREQASMGEVADGRGRGAGDALPLLPDARGAARGAVAARPSRRPATRSRPPGSTRSRSTRRSARGPRARRRRRRVRRPRARARRSAQAEDFDEQRRRRRCARCRARPDVGRAARRRPRGWLLESLLALVVSVLPSAPALGAEDAVQTIASLFLDGARGAAALRDQPGAAAPFTEVQRQEVSA